MSKDGRGTPGHIITKNHQPRLKLADLLRRRRSNLKAFIAELGVTTHAGLAIWCERMGVSAPSVEEFELAFPSTKLVNSPQEGIIVLEPPHVVDAETGAVIDPDAPTVPGVEVITSHDDEIPFGEPLTVPQKKARKRREEQTTDE